MFPEIKSVPNNFDEMVVAMLKCEQTAGQSVYQHGTSVREHLRQLINYLQGETLEGQWKLPEWLLSHRELILGNLHSEEDMGLYAQYHDCGKPYVLQIDSEGKRHFPNHAAASGYIWGLVSDNETVKRLIENDMALHVDSAEEIDRKLTIWDKKDAVTLLLTGLAEIHSNAKLFGGVESVSFKMKWKKLEKRGKQVLKSAKYSSNSCQGQ